MKGKPLSIEIKDKVITDFDDSGDSLKEIAKRMNISVTAVSNILSEYYSIKLDELDEKINKMGNIEECLLEEMLNNEYNEIDNELL